MGTYTDFTIDGYPLVQTKSSVLPEIMTIFRESDKTTIERYGSDRNPFVWGFPSESCFQEQYIATLYSTNREHAIGRLEAIGFTLERVKLEYEHGWNNELSYYQDCLKDNPQDIFYQDMLHDLSQLNFNAYLVALGQVVKCGLLPDLFDDAKKPGISLVERYILEQNDEYYFGFFSSDIRHLVRSVLEVVPEASEVIQDITELVDGEFYSDQETVCKNSVDSISVNQLENFNIIVLTEGVTDTRVLSKSLELLYPHLTGYYSFQDFTSSKSPGGAGQLATLVKGFASSGIGNRIIAIFDNDSAGRDSMRQLERLELPSNIAILKYPDQLLFESYPTIGPTGNADIDVNGLAASIELYFGTDVLMQNDETLTPVQWKGYIASLRCYQGEVTGKDDLIKTFNKKLQKALATKSLINDQDWSGINSILNVIIGAFKL